MKKLNVKKDGVIVNQGIFKSDQEIDVWLENEKRNNCFGKPDRWVREDHLSMQSEDVSKAIGQLTEDDNGKEFQVYRFAAEYEVEIIDITAEVDAEKTIKAAKESKKAELVALKGRSLTAAEVKQAVELFIEIWPI